MFVTVFTSLEQSCKRLILTLGICTRCFFHLEDVLAQHWRAWKPGIIFRSQTCTVPLEMKGVLYLFWSVVVKVTDATCLSGPVQKPRKQFHHVPQITRYYNMGFDDVSECQQFFVFFISSSNSDSDSVCRDLFNWPLCFLFSSFSFFFSFFYVKL